MINPIIVLDIFYKIEMGLPNLYLVARNMTENKRLLVKIKDFYPYFYVTRENENEKYLLESLLLKKEIKDWLQLDINTSMTTSMTSYFRGGTRNVVKIVGKLPHVLPQIKNIFQESGLHCFEYDIPFVHRFLIDTDIRCFNPLFLDINDELPELESQLEISFSDLTKVIKKNYNRDFEPTILIASIDIETGNKDGVSLQKLMYKKDDFIIAISISYGWLTLGKLGQIKTQSFMLKSKTAHAEKFMLRSFLSFLDKLDPDIVVTYNGDNFDFPYLEHRLKLYNQKFLLGLKQHLIKSNIDNKFRMPGKAFVDLFPKCWSIHTKSGRKRLVDIAEYFFKETDPTKLLKLNLDQLPGEVWESGDFALLKTYVEQDTIITMEIAEKLLIGDLAIAKVNGFPISDVILATGRVNGELELIRIVHQQKTLIPPKPKKNMIEENKRKRKEHPHSGGQVITPTKSQADNIIIADFVSMYPTLMASMNIGSESFVKNLKFKSAPTTSLSLLQRRIIDKRLQIKNEAQKLRKEQKAVMELQQKALKLVANSMYGATLYVQGRFFDIEVCNAITELARQLMNNLFDLAEKFGQENNIKVAVLYSDTDSVFIQILPREIVPDKERNAWLQATQKSLLNFLNKNVPEGMKLSLEDIATRIIFQKIVDKVGEIRKKAYAYYSILTNKLVIKGFEAIRSDLSLFTKNTQEALFYILLNEKHPEQKALKYLKKQITYLRKETNKEKLLNLLTISGIIRRAPRKYKAKTPAIGAFLHYCSFHSLDPDKQYLNFSRFPYVITIIGKKNDPLFKRARHPDLVRSQGYTIDREAYINEIVRIAEKFDLSNPMIIRSKNIISFLHDN